MNKPNGDQILASVWSPDFKLDAIHESLSRDDVECMISGNVKQLHHVSYQVVASVEGGEGVDVDTNGSLLPN